MYKYLDKEGKIPPHTVCPFRDQCELAKACSHTGVNHDVPYSCAVARAFEIIGTKPKRK